MHDQRLKDIVPFVASVESGSFAAAAERLHLTGSAISKSVTRLEARLGSRLLERTTRSLTLTDAGSAYYQTCLRIMEELAEAHHSFRAVAAGGAEYLWPPRRHATADSVLSAAPGCGTQPDFLGSLY